MSPARIKSAQVATPGPAKTKAGVAMPALVAQADANVQAMWKKAGPVAQYFRSNVLRILAHPEVQGLSSKQKIHLLNGCAEEVADRPLGTPGTSLENRSAKLVLLLKLIDQGGRKAEDRQAIVQLATQTNFRGWNDLCLLLQEADPKTKFCILDSMTTSSPPQRMLDVLKRIVPKKAPCLLIWTKINSPPIC